MRLRSVHIGGGTLVSLGLFVCQPAEAVVPHRSMATLSASNGRGAVVYDALQHKVTEFLEHPYQAPTPTTVSRNFAFDSYPGIRVGTTGTWLNTVAPSLVEYLPGTGIVHTARTLAGLTLDEYHFAPMGLADNASVMLVKVTGASTSPVDLYGIFNYHLGTGSPAPGADSESISYDAAHDAYYETGPSGVAMAYLSLAPSSHHGATPNNPFGLLNAGSNLLDDPGTGGPVTDAVAGFQSSLGTLAAGGSAWAGWVTVLAPDANGANAATAVRTWLAGRAPAAVLSDEQAAWASWVTPPPAGASPLEAALDQHAQVLLRMGQVTEPAPAGGQILAAITPGAWNITWVRDMAYATVALVKSHHYAEAKAALAFQMGATVGAYTSYVARTGGAGLPYQISVCRYYGNGAEWSDSNTNGPNVEFDGFGLFLWALDTYVTASGDTASLQAWWPTVKPKVADVLVGLEEPTGLLAADSSIWEVHWAGQQRHFAYTTASAANGLCSASRLATGAGDAASAASYLSAGQKARDALVASLRGPDGSLAQSTEALLAGTAWLDASTIEALNWGLLDPSLHTAQATMGAMVAGLVPPSGRGFMRDQTGAYYDSQEWVFIDLRSDRAFGLASSGASYGALASATFAWNTDQGAENFDELSELHDATTADYAGAAPMVGFGSGAYLLTLRERGETTAPTCGAFATEPAIVIDAGVDAGPFPVLDAALPLDATAPSVDGGRDAGPGTPDGSAPTTLEGGKADGAATPLAGSTGGCSASGAGPTGAFGLTPLLGAAMAAAWRKRRRAA